MRARSVPALYLLLVLVAAISAGYYLAGAAALREEFFHAAKYAREPFDFGDDGQTLTSTRKEAEAAGLRKGDVLVAVNGKPYSGSAQLHEVLERSKPLDILTVSVRTASGQTKEAHIPFHPREGPDFTVGGYIAFLTPILGVPLLGLILGYWVVAARPTDLNAWLVLTLLIFPETAFGNLDWSFWPAPWYLIFGVWDVLVQMIAFVALLWFGIYFPDRWRLDRRLPWVKWFALAAVVWAFAVEIRGFRTRFFDIGNRMPELPLEVWADRVDAWATVISIVVFLFALFDKLRTASTPDARRRLRVLAIGSALSLGPLLIIFGILPRFGIDPHHGQWFTAIIPFVALFPLTLAYVVIVQRAMDVRILLRMGTRYLLARATLLIFEIGIAALLVLGFILPMMQRKEHEMVNLLLLAAVVAGFLWVFAVRDSLSNRMRRWLDRKFFREAYNTEIVLSELSDKARKFTDKAALMDTVLKSVSEVLHVPQIAVWLHGNRVFLLQQAIGIDMIGPVVLAEQSATVRNLVRTNRPATVYRDRPEDWFAGVGAQEKEVLDRVNAELLLPLPGRDRLMGLMALGPKLSEAPYTPTDLRTLQSVAAQTGLALEMSELVQSLAAEAAQRERIKREIEIARDVQQHLFPQRNPEVPGVSLAGTCRPALEVGGDYYDLIELEGGKLGFAIGDISGKGISAALLMASLRASLRGLTLDGPGDLPRMMEKMNRLVYEASANNRYATFFFATYDPATRELHYINAGHNAPMLVRNGAQEALRLEAGGVVVGLLPVASYETQSVVLEPGDLLLAYTDGISEAMTVADEEWGEERMLAAALRSSSVSAEAVMEAIFRAADEFTAGAPQHDDMTLLIMKLESA